MSSTKKLIVRIKGGLGNQLFCYAAGKRLAKKNSAEFILDNITGFEKDFIYQRTYQLKHFNIEATIASASDRLEPLKDLRKDVLTFIGKRQNFIDRKYIFQEKTSFDKRLLEIEFDGTRFLDGYWQSEKYFKDIEHDIRKELTLKNELDELNKSFLEQIKKQNSVAIHFRWFDELGTNEANNTDRNYYKKAIQLVKSKHPDIHFFVFSDNTEAASKVLDLNTDEYTIIAHNNTDETAYKDLFLISQCDSIIMANSSFSWWAAWLGDTNNNLIICPGKEISHEGRITSWNFDGQLPERWLKL
jgi:hypothetical protein